jgi:hypothetical protein
MTEAALVEGQVKLRDGKKVGAPRGRGAGARLGGGGGAERARAGGFSRCPVSAVEE